MSTSPLPSSTIYYSSNYGSLDEFIGRYVVSEKPLRLENGVVFTDSTEVPHKLIRIDRDGYAHLQTDIARQSGIEPLMVKLAPGQKFREPDPKSAPGEMVLQQCDSLTNKDDRKLCTRTFRVLQHEISPKSLRVTPVGSNSPLQELSMQCNSQKCNEAAAALKNLIGEVTFKALN